MPERPFNDALLAELERLFSLQISKIQSSLTPPAHAQGPARPSLATQEAILLGELEEDDDGQ